MIKSIVTNKWRRFRCWLKGERLFTVPEAMDHIINNNPEIRRKLDRNIEKGENVLKKWREWENARDKK